MTSDHELKPASKEVKERVILCGREKENHVCAWLEQLGDTKHDPAALDWRVLSSTLPDAMFSPGPE